MDGAKSTPKLSVSPRSFGGTVANVDDWAWITIFGLFVLAIVVGYATRPG